MFWNAEIICYVLIKQAEVWLSASAFIAVEKSTNCHFWNMLFPEFSQYHCIFTIKLMSQWCTAQHRAERMKKWFLGKQTPSSRKWEQGYKKLIWMYCSSLAQSFIATNDTLCICFALEYHYRTQNVVRFSVGQNLSAAVINQGSF